jgi:hypothetical protein
VGALMPTSGPSLARMLPHLHSFHMAAAAGCCGRYAAFRREARHTFENAKSRQSPPWSDPCTQPWPQPER